VEQELHILLVDTLQNDRDTSTSVLPSLYEEYYHIVWHCIYIEQKHSHTFLHAVERFHALMRLYIHLLHSFNVVVVRKRRRRNQLITDNSDSSRDQREEENTLEFACVRKIIYKLLKGFVVLPISLC
jgi:hypothetical protein